MLPEGALAFIYVKVLTALGFLWQDCEARLSYPHSLCYEGFCTTKLSLWPTFRRTENKKIGTENAKKRENALQGHCESYTEKNRFWNSTIWSAAKVFQNRVSDYLAPIARYILMRVPGQIWKTPKINWNLFLTLFINSRDWWKLYSKIFQKWIYLSRKIPVCSKVIPKSSIP